MRKLRNLIRRFENEPAMHGLSWSEKMATHYKRMLDELAKLEPEKYRDA